VPKAACEWETSNFASSTPIPWPSETEVGASGMRPLQSVFLGGSGRTLMSGIAKSPSGNLRLGWTGSHRRSGFIRLRRPLDTPEPSPPPRGQRHPMRSLSARTWIDTYLNSEGFLPMHQLVLITALSASLAASTVARGTTARGPSPPVATPRPRALAGRPTPRLVALLSSIPFPRRRATRPRRNRTRPLRRSRARWCLPLRQPHPLRLRPAPEPITRGQGTRSLRPRA
jgi:hypothetical protein